MSRWGSWTSTLERRHQARSRTLYRLPRAITLPGGRATVIVIAIVWVGLNYSLALQAYSGGAEASGTVVKTWGDAKGNKYADAVFTTPSGRRVRASIGEDDWAAMPDVGEKVRMWYQPDHAADSAVDARLRGLGVGWQEHAVIWLISVAVVVTTAYRYWVKDNRTPRDLTARRSPDDAPPLGH